MSAKKILNLFFRPKVGIIRIDGEINTYQTHQIELSLKRVPMTAEVLFLGVNSAGGSAIQSQIIMDKIKNFTKKKNLECYPFVEDMAASGGYLISSCGIFTKTL